MCVFLLHSQLRSSIASAVFDFSDSLSDVAPVFPMLFPINVKRKEKKKLMGAIYVSSFLLSSQLRLSSVSVVFDFSASLNDAAPVSPTLLSDVKGGKKE